jgi:hypothetical protein
MARGEVIAWGGNASIGDWSIKFQNVR